jgi:hypothetical protein
VPFVEEPKVATPLDCHVAAGLQARPLDGGNARAWTAELEQSKSPTPEAGAARGSCPSPWSRNRTGQGQRRPCLHLHRPFIELFNTTSPERQGAGLQHREDVAVEAMDRAALLPLLQAVPRCSSPPPRRRVQSAR